MTDLLKAHALLVVPSDDLRGMLEPGGFRPPKEKAPTKRKPRPLWPRWRQALALRWEGQDMPHGWLAAERALNSRLLWGRQYFTTTLTFTPSSMSHLISALQAGGCTLIALDEQGKEMTDD